MFDFNSIFNCIEGYGVGLERFVFRTIIKTTYLNMDLDRKKHFESKRKGTIIEKSRTMIF
jgi:hypothetical protein